MAHSLPIRSLDELSELIRGYGYGPVYADDYVYADKIEGETLNEELVLELGTVEDLLAMPLDDLKEIIADEIQDVEDEYYNYLPLPTLDIQNQIDLLGDN